MSAPRILAALAAALLTPPGLFAAPYIPLSPDTALETVAPATDAVQAQLDALRAALARSPTDARLAARYARSAIERGRALGDPRYIGLAEAALEPWRDADPVPFALRVLRATLLQHRHDFGGALLELDRALADQPGLEQALLTRATLHQLQGRLDAALADCAALARSRSAPSAAVLCRAAVHSVGGKAGAAREAATRVAAVERDPSLRLWALTLLAETLARTGSADAERAFAHAHEFMLASGRTDLYLLAAHADFLLDRGRAEQVLSLLADWPATDSLLLRQARAERLLGTRPERLAALRETLLRRFAAARARGDAPHAREEAWFALQVEDAPLRALPLAQANWREQREPLDARLLLEAALGAGNRAAARPVLHWMSTTGIEDVALEALRVQLESRR